MLEEMLLSMTEYFSSLDCDVPENQLPFRKFIKDVDTYIPCQQITPEEYEKQIMEAETEVPAEEPKPEEPKPEGEAAGLEGMKILSDRPEFVMPKEDEYDDDIAEYDQAKKFEITELWDTFNKCKDTYELKKLNHVLKTGLIDQFVSKEVIAQDINPETLDFTPEKDIENIFRCRLLRVQCAEDYDNDELDYLIMYDMISDIVNRFSETTFVASNQIFKLQIPGLSERMIFDVIISDYFQLPSMDSHHLSYITTSTIIERSFKRIGLILCPIIYQTMNLCIKKMPRMDPEIKIRFETMFALLMNHLDFNFNFDILKRITDTNSEHFAQVKSLFDRLTIFTYFKKLEEILKTNSLPEDWVVEGYTDPRFTHDEEEQDIKAITEKIRFRDESVEEFETLLNSDDLEHKEEGFDEFLLESIFRKAHRNYSFMQKVLDHYAETLQNHFKNKGEIPAMLNNLLSHNIQRYIIFIWIFLSNSIIDLENILAYFSESELNQSHYFILYKLIERYLFDQKYDEVKQIFEWLSEHTANHEAYVKCILRKYRA